MALHTYTPTEWKNAPDHKTTPINATNLNNIETGIENAYTDISGIDSVVADKAEKDDLTNISETGATASQAISVGTYFYLEGTLVRAKTAIASGATFTLNTNYEVVSAGALNKIGKDTGWIDVNGNYLKYRRLGNIVDVYVRPSVVDTANWQSVGSLPSEAQPPQSCLFSFTYGEVYFSSGTVYTKASRIDNGTYITYITD